MSATQLHQMLDDERARRAAATRARVQATEAIATVVAGLHTAYREAEPELLPLKLLGDYGATEDFSECQARSCCHSVCRPNGLTIELASRVRRSALALTVRADEADRIICVLERKEKYPYRDTVLETLDAAAPTDAILGVMFRHLMGDVVLEPVS